MCITLVDYVRVPGDLFVCVWVYLQTGHATVEAEIAQKRLYSKNVFYGLK